jgi:hypothetical protein
MALREIEEHRLRGHGSQVLTNTGALIDELLTLKTLLMPCRRLLRLFRLDLADVTGEQLPEDYGL